MKQRTSTPKKVHIVLETVIPEDGERYTSVVAVFSYKPDANRCVKNEMINWLWNNHEYYANRGDREVSHRKKPNGPLVSEIVKDNSPDDIRNVDRILRSKWYKEKGLYVHQFDFLSTAPMDTLTRAMYDKGVNDGEETWMRPRWHIETCKLTPKSQKRGKK